MRKKTEKLTGIVLDEVYYVSVGEKAVGKASVRITRFPSNKSMFVTYKNKQANPKRLQPEFGFTPYRNPVEERRNKKRNYNRVSRNKNRMRALRRRRNEEVSR